jgi:UDP-GlcNAc3NAcA epimerase
MIAAIVGARPNFVKHAALFPYLPENSILIHTGQHYDYEMSKTFFEHLSLPEPDVNLGVREGTDCRQIGNMLIELENYIRKHPIEIVIVYGDTNSSLAGGICSNKLGIRLAHVEAGVRHFNRSVPEENNRVILDHLADILFCPTKKSLQHLSNENCHGKSIFSGDLHYDLFIKYQEKYKNNPKKTIRNELPENDFILATVHRQSNTDIEKHLVSIVDAFLLSEQNILFPIHPRTKKALKYYDLWQKVDDCPRLKIIEPLNYIEFINALLRAKKVLTDSGGVQKEAFFAGVPCVTLRDYTPWPETKINNWNLVIATTTQNILWAIEQTPEEPRQVGEFGKGNAAEIIAQELKLLKN